MMDEKVIKVLIADDHQMFIDGVKALLEDHDKILVTATANNGKEVLEELKERIIDVAILDINMPEMDGLEAAKAIKKDYPKVKVIALTMYIEKELIAELLKAGASGYILKNTGKDELEAAIFAVVNGERYFSEDVAKQMLDAQLSGDYAEDYNKKEQDTGNLSKREVEVLKLIASEFTTSQIAEKLFISNYTVETHRKNLIRKLEVTNVAGLVKFAVQKGLVD